MGIQVELKPVANLTNENSAVQILNENFQAILAAFQQVLSTVQEGENTMNVPLDMNSQEIINIAEPLRPGDVTSKQYVDSQIETQMEGLVEETVILFVEKEGQSGYPVYLHTQSVAATTWVIVHNLNTYPSVTVYDSNGNHILAEFYYTDSNTVEVRFAVATAGIAYIK